MLVIWTQISSHIHILVCFNQMNVLSQSSKNRYTDYDYMIKTASFKYESYTKRYCTMWFFYYVYSIIYQTYNKRDFLMCLPTWQRCAEIKTICYTGVGGNH